MWTLALQSWGAATQGDWHADGGGCALALQVAGWELQSSRGSPVPWERLGADVNQSLEAAWSTLPMGGRGLAERGRQGRVRGQGGPRQPASPLCGVAGMCELPVGQIGTLVPSGDPEHEDLL